MKKSPLLNPLPDPPDVRDRWLLRIWLAGCQAAAIWLTWNLWQARGSGQTPNLPMLDAAWVDACQFSFAWPLLLSLVLSVIWPTAGIVGHCGLLALAIALDQMRIQPEFISVAIVMAGTLPRRGPLLLARSHLISLWCFAGLHKLVCPEYWVDTGPYLARSLFGASLSEQPAIVLGILIACSELAVGLSAILPYTRRAVPMLALFLHTGILASLIAQQWNTAVWPWNFALGLCGFGLFFGWHGPLLDWGATWGNALRGVPWVAVGGTANHRRAADSDPSPSEPPALRMAWQATAIFVLLHPVLYYLGCADAYVSWCVYSNNTPEATYVSGLGEASFEGGQPPDWVWQGGGSELLFREYAALNVPFTPSPRVYRAYLKRAGQADDAIAVYDPRLLARWRGTSRVLLVKKRDGTIAEVRPASMDARQ